jgi:hypothetical protein
MPLTTRELATVIGTVTTWKVSADITVDVEILDSRQVFGRTDVLIRPVAGTGTTWVAITQTTGT